MCMHWIYLIGPLLQTESCSVKFAIARTTATAAAAAPAPVPAAATVTNERR